MIPARDTLLAAYDAVIEEYIPLVAIIAVCKVQAITIAFEIAKEVDVIIVLRPCSHAQQ